MTHPVQYYTFNPALLAFLFNRYRVKGDALYNRELGRRMTHGANPMRLSPQLLQSLGVSPSDLPAHFPFTLVAYILHHVKPRNPPPDDRAHLHLYKPEDFTQRRMSRDARVVHVSYNRADFSKDNLKRIQLG